MTSRPRRVLKPSSNLGRPIDIIKAILNSKYSDVVEALESDGRLINAIHAPSGMNAPMLAAAGRLPAYINAMANYGDYLDFSHLDNEGENLLAIALSSLHEPTVDAVQELYEKYARHIINNWPDPGI